MSQKAYTILELSKDDFIAELKRENSRVRRSCGQWTEAWLRRRNICFKPLDNVYYSGTDPKAAYAKRVAGCIDLINKCCPSPKVSSKTTHDPQDKSEER